MQFDAIKWAKRVESETPANIARGSAEALSQARRAKECAPTGLGYRVNNGAQAGSKSSLTLRLGIENVSKKCPAAFLRHRKALPKAAILRGCA